jgi:hypothetical protein
MVLILFVLIGQKKNYDGYSREKYFLSRTIFFEYAYMIEYFDILVLIHLVKKKFHDFRVKIFLSRTIFFEYVYI